MTDKPNTKSGKSTPPPPRRDHVRIMVIDDDPDICEYMTLLLEGSGYHVAAHGNPTRALELLREQDFHVVILDIMMPEMSGMELLAELRRFDDDIAVIIFTGNPTVDSAIASMRLKVTDYIKKPFDIDEFHQSLERVLRDKGLLHDPEEQLLQAIGRNIRSRRKGANLTLKQMSRRTGLSVSLLSQIERAESSASVSSLYKLASALDCRVTDLFGEY